MVNLFWINKKFSVSCIEIKMNFPANTIKTNHQAGFPILWCYKHSSFKMVIYNIILKK